ncbi:uncharacterized protein N0V89_012110 [Didymosphaeria variabile]|uniref:Uncharacterized protein n=1 Tax=Didymosphaeria variabile TaxID=1932322 RepID=A0A9W9C5U4_9PLEO|nr:uncharacterized protein N0V89_012110 [Didymosphaeria variabile]KAJ4344370.1 hypothetical protein N0V89_012110 [Didymosphaeria variabile]
MVEQLQEDTAALIARLADTNTAAVKRALLDAVERFDALDPIALSNLPRRERTGGVETKKATTLREAHSRSWPAALWLGAHRHLRQFLDEFTRGLTLQKGSTVERKITHSKAVLDRWGSDFWFQLRSADACLPGKPPLSSRNPQKRIMNVYRQQER